MKYLKNYDQLFESGYIHHGTDQETAKEVITDFSETICELFDIKPTDIISYGSAGKLKDPKSISRNINVGINKSAILKNNDIEHSGLDNFIDNRLNMLDIRVKQDDNQYIIYYPNGKSEIEIRCDLTDNFNWMSFSRYCPNMADNESEYSGKYVQAVYQAIAKNINPTIVSYFDTNENVKEYESYYYDVNCGLGIKTNSFQGKNGKLKKSIVLDETKSIIDNNPKTVIKTLFGKETNLDDVRTFENCLKTIKSNKFEHKKKRKRILESIKKELVELRLHVPDEL